MYILLNKSTVFPTYLQDDSKEFTGNLRSLAYWRRLGQIVLSASILCSVYLVNQGKEGTYLGLICLWALPVLLFIWYVFLSVTWAGLTMPRTLAYQVILSLPLTKVLLPIALPTLYLWVVDTLSLHRGTWAISSNTKLSVFLWPHLEIEEAFFFLATNTLVVWGLCAFDNALAILDTSDRFAEYSSIKLPPPTTLIQVLLAPTSTYDTNLIQGLTEALRTLRTKSRSFFLASSTFSGPLRIDLILLYSYCRVADDLVDNARTAGEARDWIERLRGFLDFAYSKIAYSKSDSKSDPHTQRRISKSAKVLENFPERSRMILRLLPVASLPPQPLYDLLAGFETDLKFSASKPFVDYPISDATDLEKYASCVASTVAELCLSLGYHHHPQSTSISKKVGTGESLNLKKALCLQAGKKMGLALQYINIVRDVVTDAKIGRCYLPTSWLAQEGLTPENVVVSEGTASGTNKVRSRLLDVALCLYRENVEAIEDLPLEVRDGIRVAVESYVEIGRVLRQRLDRYQSQSTTPDGKDGSKGQSLEQSLKSNRATVPRLRRLYVAWKVMGGPRNR